VFRAYLPIIRRYSLYMFHPDPASCQSPKRITRTIADDWQIRPKHAEVEWRYKLRMNSASIWFSLLRTLTEDESFTFLRKAVITCQTSRCKHKYNTKPHRHTRNSSLIYPKAFHLKYSYILRCYTMSLGKYFLAFRRTVQPSSTGSSSVSPSTSHCNSNSPTTLKKIVSL
jgi:hypothetical protein